MKTPRPSDDLAGAGPQTLSITFKRRGVAHDGVGSTMAATSPLARTCLRCRAGTGHAACSSTLAGTSTSYHRPSSRQRVNRPRKNAEIRRRADGPPRFGRKAEKGRSRPSSRRFALRRSSAMRRASSTRLSIRSRQGGHRLLSRGTRAVVGTAVAPLWPVPSAERTVRWVRRPVDLGQGDSIVVSTGPRATGGRAHCASVWELDRVGAI